MTMTTSAPAFRSSRYTTGAIILHWAIALLIVGQVAGGLLMLEVTERGSALQFQLYQLHKSLGVVVLLLTIARIAWRLFNPPPPEPASVATWEKRLSHLVHVLFYVMMLAIPLTGWLMITVSPVQIETVLFFQSWLPWPHIPGFGWLSADAADAMEDVLIEVHKYLAFATMGLLAMHVAGALKHHLADGEFISRMSVWAKGDGPRRAYGHVTTSMVTVLFAAVMIGSAMVARQGEAVTASAPAAETETAAESAPAEETEAGGAPAWTVRPEESHLTFTATFSGSDVPGAFAGWSADIRFDPDDLDASSIAVTIDTASASVESSDISQARLNGSDGFHNAEHGEARFVSDTIRADGEGYVADGTLTIRGESAPQSLPFSLTIEDDVATASGELTLDRTTYGIGTSSDAEGEYLGKEVTVEVAVVADRGAPSEAETADTGGAPQWTLIPEESAVTFSFGFQGSAVEGEIADFDADIRFDAEDLPASSVAVTFDLASASVEGTAVSENQLKGPDGFATSQSSTATFVADTITATEGGYAAEGELTLRGNTQPVTLPFTLARNGERATATGEITLNRLDFGIGESNDPSGDYIAPEVTVSVTAVAEAPGSGGAPGE